jgi:hypothetical protein
VDLKEIIMKRRGIKLICVRPEVIDGFYEYGNEYSDHIKGRKLIAYLDDYNLKNTLSSTWSFEKCRITGSYVTKSLKCSVLRIFYLT